MAEPIDMGKARNAYARERDIFRRELQWALRQFDHLPLTFDMKTELRFRAADLKAERLEAYRNATKEIDSNQPILVGNNLRIRSMANSEDTFHRDRLNRSKSPISRPKCLANDDNDDIEEFIQRNRATRGSSGYRSSQGPSVPISKLTYNAHKSVNTNTHVLSFEHQLRNDIDVMISSIEQLNEQNRSTWLKVPHSNRSMHFSSVYDDTGYSVNSYLPSVPSLSGSGLSSAALSIGRPGGISNPSSSLLSSTSTSSSIRERSSESTPSKNCVVQSYYDRYLENFDKPKSTTPTPSVVTSLLSEIAVESKPTSQSLATGTLSEVDIE